MNDIVASLLLHGTLVLTIAVSTTTARFVVVLPSARWRAGRLGKAGSGRCVARAGGRLLHAAVVAASHDRSIVQYFASSARPLSLVLVVLRSTEFLLEDILIEDS